MEDVLLGIGQAVRGLEALRSTAADDPVPPAGEAARSCSRRSAHLQRRGCNFERGRLWTRRSSQRVRRTRRAARPFTRREWHFGMAHIGVDAETGTITTTPANAHDITEVPAVRSGACGQMRGIRGWRSDGERRNGIEWRVVDEAERAEDWTRRAHRRRGRSVRRRFERRWNTHSSTFRVWFAPGGCTRTWLLGLANLSGAFLGGGMMKCPTYGGVWVKRFPQGSSTDPVLPRFDVTSDD